MEKWQIVTAIVTGLISILMLIYSFFASKEKGLILTNGYLLATEQERKKVDKSAEYHLASVVFGILGLMFLSLTIRILTSWAWINYIIGLLLLVVMIYSIADYVKSERKNK